MSSYESKNDGGQKNFEDLKQLECPFTWNMDNIDGSICISYKPHDEEELIPLLKIMRIIMTIFVQSKEKKELKNINTDLQKCDEIMSSLREESDLKFSIDAVDHVLKSTKCHLYWILNKKGKAEEIFQEIKSATSLNKFEYSTINACISIGWSQYHHLGKKEALKFIRKALKDNSKCDVFHYILGKNLRRMRRDAVVGERPSNEEKNAFLKAYEISKNPVYGIFVAQMYREAKMYYRATQMYEEILRNKPKCLSIYLRLALGFMQAPKSKLPLAKQCLDEVAEKCANDSMYLHYRGHYFIKLKQYKEAAPYLRKAIKTNNFPAAREYYRCMLTIDKNFDETMYLLNLLEMFENLPEKQMQTLLLDTAFAFFKKSGIKQSLKYFVHSIEIDPLSPTLVNYYPSVNPGITINIFQILKTDIFPTLELKSPYLDDNILKMYEDLKNYHKQYLDDRFQRVQNTLHKKRT